MCNGVSHEDIFQNIFRNMKTIPTTECGRKPSKFVNLTQIPLNIHLSCPLMGLFKSGFVFEHTFCAAPKSVGIFVLSARLQQRSARAWLGFLPPSLNSLQRCLEPNYQLRQGPPGFQTTLFSAPETVHIF